MKNCYMKKSYFISFIYQSDLLESIESIKLFVFYILFIIHVQQKFFPFIYFNKLIRVKIKDSLLTSFSIGELFASTGNLSHVHNFKSDTVPPFLVKCTFLVREMKMQISDESNFVLLCNTWDDSKNTGQILVSRAVFLLLFSTGREVYSFITLFRSLARKPLKTASFAVFWGVLQRERAWKNR